MTDLVMGGSLLKILNGAPIISINKINGEEIIKLIPFFIRLNICGERGIRTLDRRLSYTPLAGERFQPLSHLSGIVYSKVMTMIV